MSILAVEQTLMRIFLGEADRWERRPLYQAVVELLRTEGFSGATVLKGTMGFGARSILHTDKILRLSADLPVVVEVVESPERIEATLPRLEHMLRERLVTLERVRVIRYSEEETC
jgi:uncharacterized protein